MQDDELEDFSLDEPALGTPSFATSPRIAATPSSLLKLDHSRDHSLNSHIPPTSSLTPFHTTSFPAITEPHSTSPRFPFPSPSSLTPITWSPATISPISFSYLDHPRVCIDIHSLDDPTDSHSHGTSSPQTPLGLPGNYNIWHRRPSISNASFSKGKGRTNEAFEGELLLPPPFLDNHPHSTRQSFDGILGSRSARQAERLRRNNEKLLALGRGPPLPFPQSLFKGLGKLLMVLGPPGGSEYSAFDTKGKGGMRRGAESSHGKKQRRRVERAESGLKGYDVGKQIGNAMAGRIRRGTSYRGFDRTEGSDGPEGETRTIRRRRSENDSSSFPFSTATPSSLLDTRAGDWSPSKISSSPILAQILGSSPPSLDDFSLPPPKSTLRRTSAGSQFPWKLLSLMGYILVGASATESSQQGEFEGSIEDLGGLIGTLVHFVGFTFFVVSHASALLVSSLSATRTLAIFLYWMILNLTGRTELSKAIVAYWRTCRKEWDRVCIEEEDGKALSTMSVLRGLVETVALHSMTRSRWLEEELVLLDEDKDSREKKEPKSPRRRPSIMKNRSANPRPQFTMHNSSYRWNRNSAREEEEEDEEADGLVVISNSASLLEGTLIASSHEGHRRKSALSSVSEPPVSDEPQISANDEEDLVALLKRCGRLSTAAYGLQTYIVSPPTPLLTPSGATLPHRLFAHLGGLKDHRNVLHVAIQQRYTDSSVVESVYAPNFYLLRDDARRQIVVVFRGTQSLADIKTDLDGDFVSLSLPSLSPNPSSNTDSNCYRIHAGILSAARHLLDPDTSPLYSRLLASLQETGYDLLLTGHSLGSALASTIALLISDYFPQTDKWTISPTSGLPAGRSIRAVAFAHPTTLNGSLATRCAAGKPPLVISVSCQSDLITRVGLPQISELRRTLGRLDRRRRRSDGSILSDWRKWRRLMIDPEEKTDGTELDSHRQEVERLEQLAWRRRKEVEDARSELAIDDETAIPAGKTYHLDELPLELDRRRRNERAEGRDSKEEDEEDDDELLLGLYEVKDPLSFYRLPILSSDLIRSHLPKEYLDAVESL